MSKNQFFCIPEKRSLRNCHETIIDIVICMANDLQTFLCCTGSAAGSSQRSVLRYSFALTPVSFLKILAKCAESV